MSPVRNIRHALSDKSTHASHRLKGYPPRVELKSRFLLRTAITGADSIPFGRTSHSGAQVMGKGNNSQKNDKKSKKPKQDKKAGAKK
jgi:hypothetical protein